MYTCVYIYKCIHRYIPNYTYTYIHTYHVHTLTYTYVYIYIQAYHELGLIHFFTCGEKEVRCWTVQKGSLAPQAAGVIHSDFERGFIKAEVTSFEDFKSLCNGKPSFEGVSEKYRQDGKN